MPRKRYTPEEIIKLLRLVEIEVGQGKTPPGKPTSTLAPSNKATTAGTRKMVADLLRDNDILNTAIWSKSNGFKLSIMTT